MQFGISNAKMKMKPRQVDDVNELFEEIGGPMGRSPTQADHAASTPQLVYWSSSVGKT